MYAPYYDAESRTLFFVDGPREEKDYFGGDINVFVCANLQNPARMASLIGRRPPFAPAVAIGYVCIHKNIGGSDMPFMAPDPENPGRVLTGILWLDLTGDDVQKIEGFELEGNLRKRVNILVHVGDRMVRAITYVMR